MSKERNDGKTGVSFRIPMELEKVFHKYCAWREDRITKSDLVAKLISDFLQSQGVEVVLSEEKPIADDDILK
ncbi:MAG: hypothetical protein RLY43_656 [Bacteroidota bacterium]